MQHVIDDIKERSVALVSRIQKLVPIARVGIVAFRDRGEEFLVRWSDLSFHASKTKAFVSGLKATAAAIGKKASIAGLEAAVDELGWRKRAKRVVIVVGSSPPHTDEMSSIESLTTEFHQAGGVVSTIDLTEQMHERYERSMHEWLHGAPPEKISPLPEFYLKVRNDYRDIARWGGGEIAVLAGEEELAQQILFFAFGSRWRKEVERYTQ